MYKKPEQYCALHILERCASMKGSMSYLCFSATCQKLKPIQLRFLSDLSNNIAAICSTYLLTLKFIWESSNHSIYAQFILKPAFQTSDGCLNDYGELEHSFQHGFTISITEKGVKSNNS